MDTIPGTNKPGINYIQPVFDMNYAIQNSLASHISNDERRIITFHIFFSIYSIKDTSKVYKNCVLIVPYY